MSPVSRRVVDAPPIDIFLLAASTRSARITGDAWICTDSLKRFPLLLPFAAEPGRKAVMEHVFSLDSE